MEVEENNVKSATDEDSHSANAAASNNEEGNMKLKEGVEVTEKGESVTHSQETDTAAQSNQTEEEVQSVEESVTECTNTVEKNTLISGLNPVASSDNLYYDSRKKHAGSAAEDVSVLKRLTPRVNCPEKIAICIDLSSEMDHLPFKLGDGSKYPPLCMVKRIVEIFVHSKSRIDKRHEFALVILHETTMWLRNFTNDPKEICSVLEDLNETKLCEDCNLSLLFTDIATKADLHVLPFPEITPPPFIFRVILIYGRSNTMPQFMGEYEALKMLQQSHYFFLDILYIHEPPSSDNRCQEIFEAFCDLDEQYKSYVFEVTRNTTKLHNCMAKLLAHPLQRPFQKDTFYKLQTLEEQV